MNSERLHERLRGIRARVAIRKWEARQAAHAGGVWFRLNLLLASTRCALVITAEEAAALRAAGFEPESVGAELEPPKLLFVVSEDMVPPSIRGTEVPLHDARQILLAPALLLIPFRAPRSRGL
jgi:hypothetical protein